MNKDTLIRAWKDPSFRAGLTAEERMRLPVSPAGEAMAELDEDELRIIRGGAIPLSKDAGSCRATCK